jgi:uncharacterized phage-associated protein
MTVIDMNQATSISNAPTSAAAVANEFLQLGESEGVSLDPMKLQKLVYYAHGWYLAYNHKPLFDDDIHAWPWGPVVPSIYGEFIDFGRHPIKNKKATILHKTGTGIFDFQFSTPSINDRTIKDFLKAIWDSHKNFSGIQLSNATHMPNEPWTIVKEKYGSLDSKPRIDNALIEAIFKAKLSVPK